MGGLLGEGGKGYVGPLSQIIGGAFPPPPPTPMKHLNNKTMDSKHRQIQKEYLLKEVLIYKEKKN